MMHNIIINIIPPLSAPVRELLLFTTLLECFVSPLAPITMHLKMAQNKFILKTSKDIAVGP